MTGNLSASRLILLVANDLIRQSRVVEGARALGYDVATVGTQEAVRDALRTRPADLLVLDLQAEEVSWREVVAAAREKADRHLPILAFGQHTKPDLLREARAAGCDLAVPRSQLVEELPQLIQRALGVE